jgi:hypothetical protein
MSLKFTFSGQGIRQSYKAHPARASKQSVLISAAVSYLSLNDIDVPLSDRPNSLNIPEVLRA